jgi:hypothetical protein
VAGAAGGGAIGLLLLLVSLLGSRHTWAGMLLLSGVFSWPAGVWVIEVLPYATTPGSRALDLATIGIGPVVNGAVIGAGLGLIDRLARRRGG